MIKYWIVLVFSFYSMVSFSTTENDTIRIATINGESLVLKELKLSELKTGNVSDSILFNSITLETAIQVKLQQQLAKKMGLVKDISYAGFLTDFFAENNRRKLALQNKEVFYGPIQFSEVNYFKYKFSNLVIGIKKQLAESEFKLTDEILKNYYETVKDSLYKIEDYLEVRRFDVIFKNRKADELQQNKTIRNIQSQISKQKSKMESLNRIFKNVCEIKSQIQIFDPTDFQYMEGEECAEVLNRIGKIETGQFCPISTQADSAYFYQLLQRKPMGYRKFESVKNSLKSCYIDLLYKKYLSEMRETAIIVRY